MPSSPPRGPADPYRIHLHTPPDGPANDVSAYVLNSRSFLKSLSGNLMAVYKSFLRGDDLRGDDDVFEQQRGVHPNIYVARLTQHLSKIHFFQLKNRKMDVILAAPLSTQEQGMNETEIELWRCASRSRSFFSDLVKRLDAAVKLNPYAPELIWPVVMAVITDIEQFLRESVLFFGPQFDIEEFLRDRARMR